MKKIKRNNGLEMTAEGAAVYGIVREGLSDEMTSWLRCEQEGAAMCQPGRREQPSAKALSLFEKQ